MRLVQFSTSDAPPRVGALDRDSVIDVQLALAAALDDGGPASRPSMAGERIPPTMELLLDAGEAGIEAVTEALEFARSAHGQSTRERVAHKLADVKLRAPLTRPGKIICIGANYMDHIKEASLQTPTEPVFFAKYRNAITGPTDPILLPAVSEQVDWEAELVVVIGRAGRDIAAADAMSHVVGYTIGNDVSARDWQMRKPFRQWMMGKTFDTFLPLGPALVTVDEVSDPQDIRITLRLNDAVMQNETTANMVFPIAELLSFVSRIVSLEPGDIMLTGSPAGVGFAQTPPRYLRHGDVLETSIEKLGSMTNPVKRASPTDGSG